MIENPASTQNLGKFELCRICGWFLGLKWLTVPNILMKDLDFGAAEARLQSVPIMFSHQKGERTIRRRKRLMPKVSYGYAGVIDTPGTVLHGIPQML
jgi:hypothetical protein